MRYKDDLIVRKKLETGINQKDLKTLKLIEQVWGILKRADSRGLP